MRNVRRRRGTKKGFKIGVNQGMANHLGNVEQLSRRGVQETIGMERLKLAAAAVEFGIGK